MSKAPPTVILAMLLGLAAAQAVAQGFSSVSTRAPEPPTPASATTEAATAEAATTEAAPTPSSDASTPAPEQTTAPEQTPAPEPAAAAPATNPFLTGSAAAAAARGELPSAPAAAAMPAEPPNPFLTGSAAAAAAASSNPFLTGSSAAAASSSNPFLTGSAARAASRPGGWVTTGGPPGGTATPATPAPPAVAPTPANPFLTGSAAAMVLPDFSASAGTQPFGTRYDDAIAAPPRTREPADHILVRKSERRLYLLHDGRVIAQYPIKLGLNPTGPKRFEGDFRTPEGNYELVRRNSNSEFFLALEVSYPNERDIERARELGLPPGGLIMIHGQPNVPSKPADYYARNDWTNGCIALSNADMVDVWLRTDLGTPIEIQP